jgi:hypothetical protein
MFRWAAIWLGIGFALKWWNEKKGGFYERLNKWSENMFDLIVLILSFLLIFVVFGVMHLTTWQAFIVLVFWSFVIIVIKAK